MKRVEDYFVPWLRGQKMYVSPHIELAWREPSLRRMMSNENPFPPSEKVLEAIYKYGKLANRYPDQGLAVRSKIAEINGLDGPENVMIGNGSSEIYDMIFRSFLQPGEEVIQHTPCFGIYKLRCAALGGKLVSVPMISPWAPASRCARSARPRKLRRRPRHVRPPRGPSEKKPSRPPSLPKGWFLRWPKPWSWWRRKRKKQRWAS